MARRVASYPVNVRWLPHDGQGRKGRRRSERDVSLWGRLPTSALWALWGGLIGAGLVAAVLGAAYLLAGRF